MTIAPYPASRHRCPESLKISPAVSPGTFPADAGAERAGDLAPVDIEQATLEYPGIRQARAK